jgi:hypothetical protein
MLMGGFDLYVVDAEPGVDQPDVIILDARQPNLRRFDIIGCPAKASATRDISVQASSMTAPTRGDAA